MGYHDEHPNLDTSALKAAVEELLGHPVHLGASQGYHSLSYGRARVKIPTPSSFKGVLRTRPEGKGHPRGTTPEELYVATESIPNWFEVVAKQCAGVLSTGRTVEVGAGIGMYGPKRGRDHGGWHWRVNGQPCNMPWDHLVEQIEGKGHRDEAWNLAPDYQRGAVWTQEQQERFVGHVLTGGEVPDIFVQRYNCGDHAPKGTDYLDLPIEVIDGQQRLRAIVAFLKGECGAQVYHDGKWHTYQYAEMNEIERGEINGIGGMRIVYVDISREDRLRFYLRLNGGVAHTEAELDKVRRMLVTEFPAAKGERGMRHLDRIKQFEEKLAAEQTKRPRREKYVLWGKDEVPEWLKLELEMLLSEINSQRGAAELAPITMRDLRRVETMACGHSGYSHKLAIYCAELCVGDHIDP